MNKVIAINGRWFDVAVPSSGGISREIAVLDGPNADRAINGIMRLDTIGTYYNYTYKVARAGGNLAEYDALNKELRNPRNRIKMITVPFDQGFVTYEAYVSNISDSLIKMKDGKNYWDGMSIKFVAIEPNEVP